MRSDARPLLVGLISAVVALAFCGCGSRQAVATFAEDSQKALTQGPMIFRDFQQSCIRRHRDAQPIIPQYLPSGQKTDRDRTVAVCSAFGSQGDALVKASDVLVAYFRAMQQLAAFDASSVGATSGQAAENAGTGAQLNATQIDSLGKLAGLVTEAFTGRYQRSHMYKYLREADSSISSLTRGFEEIVGKDYEGLLDEEQRALTFRYQQAGDAANTPTVLLLNRAFDEDLHQLRNRKSGVEAYVGVLAEIRNGHHMLTEQAGHLSGKKVTLAIQPYLTKLEAYTADLQKVL